MANRVMYRFPQIKVQGEAGLAAGGDIEAADQLQSGLVATGDEQRVHRAVIKFDE